MKKTATKTTLTALVHHRDTDMAFVIGTRDLFIYDAASETSHDGTDTIRPTNVESDEPGRWLRVKFAADDLTVTGVDVSTLTGVVGVAHGGTGSSAAAHAHIADPAGAATDQDDEARAAIVAILDILETRGFAAGA